MEKHDKHVESIYKKIQVTRNQVSKRTKEVKDDLLSTSLQKTFALYYDLLHNPKVSSQDTEMAKRSMSKALNLCVMHTDDDVIKVLTNELIEKQYKEQMMIS